LLPQLAQAGRRDYVRRVLQRRHAIRGAAAAFVAAGIVATGAHAASTTGQIGPSLSTTGNGHLLHPIGRTTTVGNFPTASQLTRDGRYLWVVDSGHGSNDVKVVDVASGAVVQTLALPGAYGGIAFSPDGNRAYVSGTPKGSSPTEGPTKGDAGDVVHVFAVNQQSGRGSELDPIGLPASSGGSGRTNSLPPVTAAFPEGLAVSPSGRWLVVALNQADRAAVIDLSSGSARLVSVGAYPAGAAFDRRGRAYVSNEYDGTVSVLDPAAGTVVKTITGLGGAGGDRNSHPEGMVADPGRPALYVAVANRDSVAVIDTDKLAVSRSVSVGRPEGVGTAPVSVALAPDGRTLYSANAGEDSLAAISLTTRSTSGSRPASKRVVRVRGVSSVARYRSGVLRAKRAPAKARRALGRSHGGKRRAAALTRYKRAVKRYKSEVKRLRGRYLLGATTSACTGPSRRQESAYTRAVLKALGKRSSARTRARAVARAKKNLPAIKPCGPAKRVVRVRGVSSVARYRSGVLRAKRAPAKARRALGRSHGGKRRAAALTRYKRAVKRYKSEVKRLRGRYLLGATTSACTGPSRRQESAYTRAVLKALTLNVKVRHKKGRSRKRERASARKLTAAARARAIARAKRGLPSIKRCGPAAGDIPGLAAFSLIGRLPTAAYPTDVKVTPQGKLIWVAGKGLGAGPNPDYVFDGDKQAFGMVTSPYGTYVLDKLLGRVGVLASPSDVQARAMTPAADSQARPSNAQSAPSGSPVVGPGGGPSDKIKHVFYIVRENRTYDQVFGSDPRGDGSPARELFDDNGVGGPAAGITPNAHKLVKSFPLLDHTYADSEVSVDGHVITAGAYATDYVQKAIAANYAGRGRAFDFGIFPVTFPPKAFIFDQAVRQGISFRNYGEQGAGNSPAGNDGRPTFGQVVANTDSSYPGNLQIGCTAPAGPVGNLATCTQDSGTYGGTGTKIGSTSRVDTFVPQLTAQAAAGNVPAFNYLLLPNDHTNGTTPNAYTPQALVADNDLALGQIVDAISHSSVWDSSAIFVVEDDSQDGADHVDAHRMPAFVISPWAKRGAVVSTRYDQYSVLRTMGLIMGMKPLSLNDALATPMYDAFANTSDPAGTRYTAVKPDQPLNEINPARAPRASTSARLPFNRLDQVPQALSDQILWESVYGAASEPPPPGPGASPVEHERAVEASRILKRGGDPRPFLRHTGDGD